MHKTTREREREDWFIWSKKNSQLSLLLTTNRSGITLQRDSISYQYRYNVIKVSFSIFIIIAMCIISTHNSEQRKFSNNLLSIRMRKNINSVDCCQAAPTCFDRPERFDTRPVRCRLLAGPESSAQTRMNFFIPATSLYWTISTSFISERKQNKKIWPSLIALWYFFFTRLSCKSAIRNCREKIQKDCFSLKLN